MKDQEEAARWGVQSGYHDVFGGWHEASPKALAVLPAALRGGRDTPSSYPPGEPAFAYQCGSERMWGLAVQLYAVRSARNWGHGDFTDLAELVKGAAKAGASAVGLNPLHALFPDRAEDASPYSPNSRLFLNWLYIDAEALPDFPGAAALGLQDEIAALRASDMVAYARVSALKLQALRECFARFQKTAAQVRRDDFAAFRKEGGDDLAAFAAFEVLRARFGRLPWREWPDEFRVLRTDTIERVKAQSADAFDFEIYLQWVTARQLAACQKLARELAMPVGLYIDLAIGVDPAGADAWTGQGEVLADVTVGAPPDQYNPAGQNWGLTTFNPHALAESDCGPMRRMLRAAMRHAGAVRIDHVLGLMRLYLIPRDAGAADGAYVSFPFDALLTAIARESEQNRCIVIGEDLGTVPDGFRDALARHGLWTYLVMLFEREDGGGFRAPEHYSPNALATFNTHDLPTFSGWMSGSDLVFKRTIGVDPGETDDERSRSRSALQAVLGGDPNADFAAIAAFLGRSRTRLVMVAMEDIACVEDQINIPGTVEQHPNWRRRLPMSVDAFFQDERFLRVAAAFAQEGRAFSR